jgi:hypothetical protein
MLRKKCRRIVKNVSKLLLVQIVEVLGRGNRKRKEVMGKKVVSQEKYTWWISITFKRTVCRRSG